MLVILHAVTLNGAAADVASTFANADGAVQPLLWTAGVLTAVGVVYRFFHIGEIRRGTRNFLRSYNGEPARPGVDAIPGLPERIAKIETQTHEIKGRDAQLVVALEMLATSATDNGAKIDRLDDRVIAIDARVTDHRRRNEEQSHILRDELEARARSLEAKLQARNDQVDKQLSTISEDLLRAETMRAALLELGIDVEPPKKP